MLVHAIKTMKIIEPGTRNSCQQLQQVVVRLLKKGAVEPVHRTCTLGRLLQLTVLLINIPYLCFALTCCYLHLGPSLNSLTWSPQVNPINPWCVHHKSPRYYTPTCSWNPRRQGICVPRSTCHSSTGFSRPPFQDGDAGLRQISSASGGMGCVCGSRGTYLHCSNVKGCARVPQVQSEQEGTPVHRPPLWLGDFSQRIHQAPQTNCRPVMTPC